MRRRVLITGGGGFIGTNAALYFAKRGYEIVVIDNLSRRGAAQNAARLRSHPNIVFLQSDIRDMKALQEVFKEYAPFVGIFHLAAQVAVTTSIVDPRSDCEANVLGTLNVLECMRHYAPEAVFVFSSTNKVYGSLEHVPVIRVGRRYEYADMRNGVSEAERLDFHSPYGCSKGAADQYVIDYGRIYGLRTVSFRQSCIYGPYQYGIEDQGWVAWFTFCAVSGRPITIYGDGRQVRDVLHVSDLCRAFESAIGLPAAAGALNIGGGPANTVSLLELIEELEKRLAVRVALEFADWRPGDQRVYVSDIRKAREVLGWEPSVNVAQGLSELIDWVWRHHNEIAAAIAG